MYLIILFITSFSCKMCSVYYIYFSHFLCYSCSHLLWLISLYVFILILNLWSVAFFCGIFRLPWNEGAPLSRGYIVSLLCMCGTYLISCCLFCPFFSPLISFYLSFATHVIFCLLLDQFKFISQLVVP